MVVNYFQDLKFVTPEFPGVLVADEMFNVIVFFLHLKIS